MIGIYKITNKATGQFYIGRSKDIERRFREHKVIGHCHNPRMKDDFAKYGIDWFSFEVVEECNEDALKERELHYIKETRPFYNEVGAPRKDETKEKLRVSGKLQWERMTDGERRNVIQNNLKGPPNGHPVGEATRKKLHDANIGKRRYKPVMIVETGEVFPAAKELAEHLGVTVSAVNYNLNGKTERTKGYHIMYV